MLSKSGRNIMYHRYLLIMVFLLVIAFVNVSKPSNVFAQTSSTAGSISGVVSDEQGAIIAGATITIVNLSTNVATEVTTGEDGVYNFLSLRPGDYEIRINIEGFRPQSAKLTLELGTELKAKFALSVAKQVEEVIEVTASTSVNEGKTESSTNIDNGRINTLPINRRNFLDFSLTTPRVTAGRSASSVGITSDSGLSFNGQSARFNNVTIDGLDNNNTIAGSVRTTFSQEAVQEYQVITDSFSAEFGRSLGGVVNIVTKGGGNQNHGNIFFINRNDTISARDVFASFKPELQQYQFGVTLSGPIKKDKIFYFGSFERLSFNQNNIVTIRDQVVNSARRLGYDLNNGPLPFSVTSSSVLGRVDMQLSPTDTLFFRYNFGGRYDGNFESFGGLKGQTAGSPERVNDNSFAVTNTYINIPLNLVNETRLLFNRRRFNNPIVDNFSQVMLVEPTGTSVFGSSAAGGLKYKERSVNIIDNITLTRGRHLIKTGIDFDYHQIEGGILPFANGAALFVPLDFPTLFGIPTLPFFTALEAFDPSLRTPAQRGFLTFLAAGAPSMFPGFPVGFPLDRLPVPLAFLQGFGDANLKPNKKSFSGFFQDDIKLSDKLLLKLGIRYDISRLDLIPNNNGNFSPRIALAYKITPKLNLRASYGIYYGSLYVVQTFPSSSSTGATNVSFLPLPYSAIPFGLPFGRFPTLTQKGQLPPAVPFFPPLSLSLDYDPQLRAPYSQQSSLAFEYTIDPKTSVSATYSYVRGIKLFAERYANPVVRPVPGDPLGSLLTGRLDPTKGQITRLSTASDSYYHGLTLALNRRFANNFSLLANYTLAKSIDNSADIRTDLADGPVNPFDLRAERGLSTQDARHRFVASGVWALNYTQNPLLKDFQLSSIISLESGRPYNLLAGVDLNMDGDNPNFDRPPFVGRNAGVLPGFASVDLRLTRNISFKDQVKIQGFIEAFNLFNRTNIKSISRTFPPDRNGRFNLPANTGQNGRFIAPPERFTEAFAPRQFQFGIKVIF